MPFFIATTLKFIRSPNSPCSPWSPALARISNRSQYTDPYPLLMADRPGFYGGDCMKFDVHANPPRMGIGCG